MAEWFGLPIYETLIPILVWAVVGAHHMWMVKAHFFSVKQHAKTAPSVYSFFAQTRVNWVKQNHLTGQAAANSTRDYLRVFLFYAGTAVLLSTYLAGYCASSYKPDGTAYETLLTVKLGVASLLFLGIFLVMVYAVRYGTHFHMLMNCAEINGVEVKKHLQVIVVVYNKAHFFYSTGQRAYFLLIPTFAWLVSAWVMLAVCPLYLFLINQYEDVSWLQPELDKLFKDNGDEEEGERLIADGESIVGDAKA